MSTDALLPQPAAFDARPQRPLLSALTRWWSPAPPSLDAELGYESALPWTLGRDGPADRADLPY